MENASARSDRNSRIDGLLTRWLVLHRYSLLACEFPINQIPADPKRSPIFESQGLSTAKSNIGRAYWPSSSSDRSVSVQHDE